MNHQLEPLYTENVIRDSMQNVVRQKEHILVDVVSAYLGTPDWEPEDIKDRATWIRFRDSKMEHFVVDGVQLVTFHDPEMQTLWNEVIWTVKYQIYYYDEIH